MGEKNRKIIKRIKDDKFRQVLGVAVDQGATLSHSGSHIKVYHPDGVGIAIVTVTPGVRKAWYGVRADLRRIGFDI